MLKTKKKLKKKNKSQKQKGGFKYDFDYIKDEFSKLEIFFDSKSSNTDIDKLLNYEQTKNNIKTILENYHNKTIKYDVKITYPKYHGSVDIIDVNKAVIQDDRTTLKIVPQNTFLCFFSLLNSYGISNFFGKNMEDYMKNLKKNQMEQILFNLGNMTEIENFEPNLKFDNLSLFTKCFKMSSWFYPGQKYIDLNITPGRSRYDINYCAKYTTHFKSDSRPNKLGSFSKYREDLPFGTTLSYYLDILNIDKTNLINIYFIEICRGLNIDDISDEKKTLVSKMFEYEYKIYVMNKNIIKNINNNNTNLKRDLLNIGPECSSKSINNENLLKLNQHKRVYLFYNDDFTYNRKNEFMINFYNKILLDIKPNYQDMITFISISFKKQTFILNKIIEATQNKKYITKALKYISKALINKDRYLNIFLENVKVYSSIRDKNTNKNEIIYFDDNFEDFFYIYNEHLKQYLEIFNRYGFKFKDISKIYNKEIKNYNITDLSNIKKKILFDTNYKLFFNTIKNIVINKDITEFEIQKLNENITELKILENAIFIDVFNIYENQNENFNKLPKLKYLIFKNAKLSNLNYQFSKSVKLYQTLFFQDNQIFFEFKDSANEFIIHKCLLQNIKIKFNNLYLTCVDSLINKLEIEGTNLDILINKNQIKEISFLNINIKNCIFSDSNTLPIFPQQINIEYLHIINSNIYELKMNTITINTLKLSNISKFLKKNEIITIKCAKLILEEEDFGDFNSYQFDESIKIIDIKNTPFIKSSFIKHFKIPNNIVLNIKFIH